MMLQPSTTQCSAFSATWTGTCSSLRRRASKFLSRAPPPVIIIAVSDPKTRDALSRLNASIMGTDGDPFYGAPVVLIVLADRSAPTYLYDGALAMENLMLAAHASGLGSCWIHRAKEAFERPEGKQILKELGIEGDYEGIGHCVLGYPQQEGPSKTPPRKAGRVYHID